MPRRSEARKDLSAQLKRQLRDEELDSGTRLSLLEERDSLESDDTDENQVKVFERVKKAVPKFYAAVLPIVQELAAAVVKKQLGL